MKHIYFYFGLLLMLGFSNYAMALGETIGKNHALKEGNAMRPKEIDPRDTFQLTKADFKLSKSEFNQNYGPDDSALALIHIVFGDRLLGFLTLPVYPLAIVLPALLTKGHTTSDLFVGVGDIKGVGTATAGVTSLSGVYILMTNTRQMLARELKFYRLKGYLSEDYHIRVKQRLFRLSRKVHKPKILQKKKE